MNVQQIYEILDQIAPRKLAVDWDNSGLLIGDPTMTVTKIFVCLDVTKTTVAEAKNQGCNLIISHHPMIWKAQKSVVLGKFESDLTTDLIKNDIALISCHIVYDNAEFGINYHLAKAFGFEEIRKFDVDDNNAPLFVGEHSGITGADLLKLAKTALDIEVVRHAGVDLDKVYQKFAICGGSAMDYWQDAKKIGCQVLISSEGKHSDGIAAAHAGFALIDGTHFSTEIIGMKFFAQTLAEILPEMAVVFTQTEENPWQLA